MNITVLNILQWIVYFISLYFSVFWLMVYLEGDIRNNKNKKIKTTFPTVTVAIPAYNEENTIKKTIKSVFALNYPQDKLRVVAINDGSTDNTHKIMQEFTHYNNFEIINKKNAGKGAGLNDAIRKYNSEYFVCLDADSEVAPNTLKEILSDFVCSNTAAVLPVMKIKNDTKLNLLQKVQWYEYLVNVFYKKLMGKLDCIHVTPGPFSVYKRQIIIDVGYFDENNLTEDLELALRLQKYNYKLIQNMKGTVYTPAMPTLKQYYHQRNRWFKGGLFNALKYKEMFFNKKWGDFGFIQIPILVISGIISLVLIGTLIYNLINPVITGIKNAILVNFDIMTLIDTFSFNFNILNVSIQNILLIVIMLTMSITILKLSTKYTKEKTNKYGFGVLFSFMFFYFFLLALVWVGIVKDLVFRKVQKW